MALSISVLERIEEVIIKDITNVRRSIILSVLFLLLATMMSSCGGGGSTSNDQKESREAKQMLQGVWIDAETEDVTFRVKGDTIYYADSVSMPAYFRIIGDSLVLNAGTRYRIEKQTPHIFWFRNQNGDVLKLQKSDDPEDASSFIHEEPRVMSYTHQVKTDSVVLFGGKRYHWYVAINPTKYKVVKKAFTAEGVEVENVYYDNIMHISLYQDGRKLFSSDFRKQQYEKQVPADFLEQAILANMGYSHTDAKGLHFHATLCIPDGASCYLVDNIVSFGGKLTKNLVEY